MGSIDPNIIKSKQISISDLDDIRSKALVEFSKNSISLLFQKNY